MIRDGYYLAIYSHIDPVLNMLGSSLRHDHNMSLFLKEGSKIELIHHWEFERITGFKHHIISFYQKSDLIAFINKQLSCYNLTIEDMECIIGTPGISTVSDFHNVHEHTHIAYHSISHLFSSLFVDPNAFYNNNILALAFDGASDEVIDEHAHKKFQFCGAVCQKGKLEIFEIQSPGIFWRIASHYFSKPEGTLMALAYACNAQSIESFKPLPDYFKYGDAFECTDALQTIIKCIYSYTKNDENEKYVNYDDRFTEDENKISMIMKIVQNESLRKSQAIVQNIIDRFAIDPRDTYLSISGGYALNCPSNSYLMEEFGFKEQLCCPCVNDGGLAIGMGIYYFYKHMEFIDFKFNGAYYGNGDTDIEYILDKYKNFIKTINYEATQKNVVDDLMIDPIVWFDGRSEIGPRALGHRSILANPYDPESKDKLNIYKKREWWRPVAPIVLENKIEDWFIESYKSPYMLNNFKVRNNKKHLIPSVLHIDMTARVQTINSTNDKSLFNLLTEFENRTGIPILCNTSLNDKGEPIIDNIEQAFNFALRKKINVIYINHIRIELENHSEYTQEGWLSRETSLFTDYHNNRQMLLSEINPHNLSEDALLVYKLTKSLHNLDINIEEHAMIVKHVAEKVIKTNNMVWQTNPIHTY